MYWTAKAMSLTNLLLSFYTKFIRKYLNSVISNIAIISFMGYFYEYSRTTLQKNTADYEYAYCRK